MIPVKTLMSRDGRTILASGKIRKKIVKGSFAFGKVVILVGHNNMISDVMRRESRLTLVAPDLMSLLSPEF
jgi:hypothetical protein